MIHIPTSLFAIIIVHCCGKLTTYLGISETRHKRWLCASFLNKRQEGPVVYGYNSIVCTKQHLSSEPFIFTPSINSLFFALYPFRLTTFFKQLKRHVYDNEFSFLLGRNVLKKQKPVSIHHRFAITRYAAKLIKNTSKKNLFCLTRVLRSVT